MMRMLIRFVNRSPSKPFDEPGRARQQLPDDDRAHFERDEQSTGDATSRPTRANHDHFVDDELCRPRGW